MEGQTSGGCSVRKSNTDSAPAVATRKTSTTENQHQTQEGFHCRKTAPQLQQPPRASSNTVDPKHGRARKTTPGTKLQAISPIRLRPSQNIPCDTAAKCQQTVDVATTVPGRFFKNTMNHCCGPIDHCWDNDGTRTFIPPVLNCIDVSLNHCCGDPQY